MKKIAVPEEDLATLYGAYDENLKQLESLFGVRIRIPDARRHLWRIWPGHGANATTRHSAGAAGGLGTPSIRSPGMALARVR